MNSSDPVPTGGLAAREPDPEAPDTVGSFSLPDGPGFPTLVGIHLRGLWKEFPVAWIAFGGLALLLPAASLLYRGPVDPEAPPTVLVTVMTLAFLLGALSGVVAFLWPDAVWRNLPPGGRSAMDALPVSRRVHRLARVTAGLVLPLGIAASVGVAATILGSGPGSFAPAFGPSGLGAEGSGLAGALIAMGSLTAAYLLSTALAIRFGRVLLGLFTLAAGSTLLVFLLVMVGWESLAIRLQQALFLGHWAPGRTLVLASSAEVADLGPVLLWLVVLFGIVAVWAGRHDRA